MTAYRMNDEAYAKHHPYVEELMELLDRQIKRHPDPQVLGNAWRVAVVMTLAEIVRVYRLLPDQIDDYLTRFCLSLIEATKTAVANRDRDGIDGD
jgi:hypothetical protein